MASRKTLQEARELANECQSYFPTAKFRIIDNSKRMMIGRGAAEMNGYTILEDDGSIMVLAEVTSFEVLEVRSCKCGNEVLTAAIGEAGLDECQPCREARQTRQAHEIEEGIARNQATIDRHIAFDEWNEPGR